jgi:16S rRNA processing protein RimM
MPSEVPLAAVIAAHGLKGEVRVKLFTESAARLLSYATLHTTGGKTLRVSSARDVKPGEAIVAFAEVVSRADADELRGKELFVQRSALPEPGSNEFYHADLIGLRADDSEDRTIGHVRAIHNYGAGDVIEIVRSDGDSVLIAFTGENVPVVDVKGGRIVVAVPEEVEARTKGTIE